MKGQPGAAGAAVASGGAAAAAAASAACCAPIVSPLLVTVLGASGAVWVTGLEPYSPYLLGGSIVLIGYAFWRVYGSGRGCGLPRDGSGRIRWIGRITLALLWISALVWIGAVVGYFAIT